MKIVLTIHIHYNFAKLEVPKCLVSTLCYLKNWDPYAKTDNNPKNAGDRHFYNKLSNLEIFNLR